MSFRATILGCGSSGGVPRIGDDVGRLRSAEPEEPPPALQRCSSSGWASARHTTVLVDTSPDLREQLLGVRGDALDGVLYTHDHADHTHGIDDLRMVAYAMKRRLDVWADEPTRASLEQRFAYCFAKPPGSSLRRRSSARIRSTRRRRSASKGRSGDHRGVPDPADAWRDRLARLRFGGLAYSPDISDVPDGIAAAAAGPRRVDRRCAALHAASEPLQRQAGARMDRAPEARSAPSSRT